MKYLRERERERISGWADKIGCAFRPINQQHPSLPTLPFTQTSQTKQRSTYLGLSPASIPAVYCLYFFF